MSTSCMNRRKAILKRCVEHHVTSDVTTIVVTLSPNKHGPDTWTFIAPYPVHTTTTTYTDVMQHSHYNEQSLQTHSHTFIHRLRIQATTDGGAWRHLYSASNKQHSILSDRDSMPICTAPHNQFAYISKTTMQFKRFSLWEESVMHILLDEL